MPTLYAHPLSSYCQKVLIALYENDTPFDYRLLSPESPQAMEELKAVWPIGKFPVLTDDGHSLIEASVIVEYLDLRHAGPVRFLPEDPVRALDVRFWDRFFDNYIATPQQAIVGNSLRPEDKRDPYGVDLARKTLDTAYGFLDAHMTGREWVAGEAFSLADCSAAPQLFYADWTHAIGDRFPNVTTYRQRLLKRPSFARCVEEARPYRHLFPLGAPDRD